MGERLITTVLGGVALGVVVGCASGVIYNSITYRTPTYDSRIETLEKDPAVGGFLGVLYAMRRKRKKED